jgi:hypothetical protein
VVARRGRWKTGCARGADRAASYGRSTSPLGGSQTRYPVFRQRSHPTTTSLIWITGDRSVYFGMSAMISFA